MQNFVIAASDLDINNPYEFALALAGLALFGFIAWLLLRD